MSKDKKVKAQRAKVLEQVGATAPHDEEFAKLHPTVADLLWPRWVDGKPTRQSGSIGIGIAGSLFRITVRCPTERLEAVLFTDSLVDVLGQLERYVVSGAANWVPTYASQKRDLQFLDKLLE